MCQYVFSQSFEIVTYNNAAVISGKLEDFEQVYRKGLGAGKKYIYINALFRKKKTTTNKTKQNFLFVLHSCHYLRNLPLKTQTTYQRVPTWK